LTKVKNSFFDLINGSRYYLDKGEHVLYETSRDFEEYLDTQYKRLQKSKRLDLVEPKFEDIETYINIGYKEWNLQLNNIILILLFCIKICVIRHIITQILIQCIVLEFQGLSLFLRIIP